jgi:hypothetical protein
LRKRAGEESLSSTDATESDIDGIRVLPLPVDLWIVSSLKGRKMSKTLKILQGIRGYTRRRELVGVEHPVSAQFAGSIAPASQEAPHYMQPSIEMLG